MRIEELNIIISDIEDMLLKSVSVDIDNNILPKMEFGIQLYANSNTNPDVQILYTI
jgi:hypothetical protein